MSYRFVLAECVVINHAGLYVYFCVHGCISYHLHLLCFLLWWTNCHQIFPKNKYYKNCAIVASMVSSCAGGGFSDGVWPARGESLRRAICANLVGRRWASAGQQRKGNTVDPAAVQPHAPPGSCQHLEPRQLRPAGARMCRHVHASPAHSLLSAAFGLQTAAHALSLSTACSAPLPESGLSLKHSCSA